MDNNEEHRGPNRGRVLVGLILVVAGLALLSDRMGITGIHLSGRYWPTFLIAFGVARILSPAVHRDGRRRSRWSGIWFVYLGLWFFVNEFHAFGLDYGTSWPLLIVGVGIGMIWRAIEHPGRRGCERIGES